VPRVSLLIFSCHHTSSFTSLQSALDRTLSYINREFTRNILRIIHDSSVLRERKFVISEETKTNAPEHFLDDFVLLHSLLRNMHAFPTCRFVKKIISLLLFATRTIRRNVRVSVHPRVPLRVCVMRFAFRVQVALS